MKHIVGKLEEIAANEFPQNVSFEPMLKLSCCEIFHNCNTIMIALHTAVTSRPNFQGIQSH